MFRPIQDKEDLERALAGSGERHSLEFKVKVEQKKPDYLQELARDLAQFANGWGGSLVVGVSDDRTIVGVTNPAQIRDWIQEAIRNHLVPSTFLPAVEQIDVGGKQIVVANVEPSIGLIAVWDRNRAIEYPYRKDHKKAYLTPDEVQTMIRDQPARAAKLAVSSALSRLAKGDLALEVPVDLVSQVWIYEQLPNRGYEWQVTRKDVRIKGAIDNESKVVLPDRELVLHVETSEGQMPVAVPYGLIKEAWATQHSTFGLLLGVRVALLGRGVTLAPF